MTALLQDFERISLAAGAVIMDVFHRGFEVAVKDDKSPVTEADEKAEALILAELSKVCPDIPVIAEEEMAAGRVPRLSGKAFILVDPLDGTKEFINRRQDFTVNIALVEDGVPVAGVVYAPARQTGWSGAAGKAELLTVDDAGNIVERATISTREKGDNIVAVASRSHNSPETVAFLEEHKITDTMSVGSSMKFCLLAQGEADVYPRFGRTMEWDTAAGDAVLRAAGGMTVRADGAPFVYGKRNQADDVDFANPGFIAWGRI
jgi:3'(2'), 5'-bisphosphate nucleotidase